jgi:ribosome maturation factor RimP
MKHEQTEQVKQELKKILQQDNIELIECKIFFSAGSWIVRCQIDYPQGGIDLWHCARINKQLVVYFEQSDILGDNFSLEVNSPGIDRPLKTAEDFSRVKGKILGLWFKPSFMGKQYLEGKLAEVKEESLIMRTNDAVYQVPLNAVQVGKEKIK